MKIWGCIVDKTTELSTIYPQIVQDFYKFTKKLEMWKVNCG